MPAPRPPQISTQSSRISNVYDDHFVQSEQQRETENIAQANLASDITTMEGHYEKRREKGALTGFGVSNIVVCPDRGTHQILSYDIRTLITYGGILNIFAKGTIFRGNYGLQLYYITHIVCLAFWMTVVHFAFEDKQNMSTDAIQALSWYLNFLVTLVLGLYLALALERWWALRTVAVGNLCDCAMDIVQQFQAYLPNEREAIRCLKRWSMASVYLLQNAARNQWDLQPMISNGRLLQHEVQGLNNIALYARAMMMWAWIARCSNEAMTKCKGPEPHSNNLYVMLDICVKARRAIQTIHTYLLTPLPFAYVHAVALLVDAMVAVTTMKSALALMKAYNQDEINYQTVLYEVGSFMTLPLLYHGLLSVAAVVHDPFGDDMSHFPMSTFELWSSEHLDTMVDGCDEFPYEEWEVLSGNPQSPENILRAELIAKATCQSIEKEEDEDAAGVQEVADTVAGHIMGEACVEVTLSIRRAMKGLARELQIFHDAVNRHENDSAQDTEYLLAKLEGRSAQDLLAREKTG